MKLSKVFISFAVAIALLAGAPQLNPPQEEADTGLNFQLQTFNSQALD